MKPKRVPLLKKGKNKKHDKLVNDYDAQKSKHLENLTTKMLEKDEKNRRFLYEPSIRGITCELCKKNCVERLEELFLRAMRPFEQMWKKIN